MKKNLFLLASFVLFTACIKVNVEEIQKFLEVSKDSLYFIADGENQNIIVNSNDNWSVKCDAFWLFVNPSFGSNDGIISITATNNKLTLQRIATITINGSNIVRTINITQAAFEPDPRDAFLGNYSTRAEFVMQDELYVFDYVLYIVKSSSNDIHLVIVNLSNEKINVLATVLGNTLSIPQQTFGSISISGSGTLNNRILTFSTLETREGLVDSIIINHTATKL